MPERLDVLKDAIAMAGLALAELDTDERFVAVNAGYLSMLGFDEPELVGQHWHVVVHPEDHARVQEAYRLARNQGRSYVEIRGLPNNSTIVHQALTVSRLTNGQGALTGYYCVRHDISAYKREQASLMLAVESAPNGFLMVDSEGQIQSANLAIEKLFGYTRVELFGVSIDSLVPERYCARHAGQRQSFAVHETSRHGGRDLVGLRKDGVEIPIQVYLNKIETDAGPLTLCTIIDIAERVRYQHQLELAKVAAEAANRAKSDFLARMSHEIRTPMNLIMGMNALLLEGPLSSKQRQHVEISLRNVRRLLRLINGILDLSKVEAGMLTLESAPFDIHEVVAECAATMSAAMERKGLKFAFHVDSDVPRYWIADAERLQQVLLNLIGNSVKFTERGKIELRVHSECAVPGELGLRFEVIDTGCGVPADKAVMIFEAFQQAEGSINRPYEGTGLGLSIARMLVEMMSGRIWVEDMPEPGAKFVFTVFFPQATEESVRASQLAKLPNQVCAVEAGTRILMVEDNPENVFLLQSYLENLSLVMDYATNGVEAVERRRGGNYDLVLMDIQMPVMDGYTATREIRAWEKDNGQSRVPIVALTAHALTGAIAESLEAGCNGHLAKPVERNDLVAAIARFARPRAMPSEPVPNAIAARRPAFLANRRVDLAKLQDALDAEDYVTIQSIGHNCKGTGAGYGFPEIAEAGAALEAAARTSDNGVLQSCIQRLERSIQINTV